MTSQSTHGMSWATCTISIAIGVDEASVVTRNPRLIGVSESGAPGKVTAPAVAQVSVIAW